MIDERQVREMLHERADAISATPRDAATAIRRARRGVMMTGLVGAVALVVVALVAIGGVRVIPEPQVPIGPPVTPPPTSEQPVPTPSLIPDPGTDPSLVDFPPGGAASTPAAGEQVVRFEGEEEGGPWIAINIYADGRVISNRGCELNGGGSGDSTGNSSGCVTPGSGEGYSQPNTGWVQQRLSPEAVEALRAELLATGLFEGKWEPVTTNNTDLLDWLSISIRDGHRTRTVRADAQLPLGLGSRDPNPPMARKLAGLEHMQAIFLDFEAWFDQSAWVDETVTPFIPSSYWFWAKSGQEDALLRGAGGVVAIERHLADLPAPVNQLLDRPGCQQVTLAEARTIVRGFDAAGISRIQEELGDWVAFLIKGGQDALAVYFEPVLPSDLQSC